MIFKKYLTINKHTVRIMEDENGSYIMQFDLNEKVILKRFYEDQDALCVALEKYLTREEILEGL